MNQLQRATFLAPVLPLLVLIGAAQAQESIDVRHRVDPDASIKVWNEGGSVRVVGWAHDSLVVTGEVSRGGGRFFIGRQGRGVAKLGLEAPSGSGQADLVVRVPATATVWVRTAGADVQIRGVAGSVDVHSVSGAIDVEGRLEHLYAESMGGDLRLAVTVLTARAKTGAGRIEFAGDAEDLTLSTVSGALSIEAPALRRGRFTTVDGDIQFRGGVPQAGSLAFEAHGGDVELRLDPEPDAAFELSTIEGRIVADIADRADEPGPNGSRTFTFETGTGESQVTVRTYSGSITVREAEQAAAPGGSR